MSDSPVTRFLISTMPAVGHVSPFLGTATELVRRGHEVWWHTASDARARVEETGARFTPMVHAHDVVPATVEAQQKSGLSAANEAMISLFVAPMLGQLQDYRDILSRFPAEVLLVDMCSLGAALLHEKRGQVWASVGINPLRTAESPPYGSGQLPARSLAGRLRNRLLNRLSQMLLFRVTRTFNAQRRQAGLPRIPPIRTVFDYLLSPYLHLQGTTPAFEFPYHDRPPQVHFVGPMLPPLPADYVQPSWWPELDAGRPVVHVTQGTVATDAQTLVLPVIEAMTGEEVLVVVTTPDPERLGSLPGNVRVERTIPHAVLLPHVAVMVTNGGYNGVKMALSHGVPLVAAGASEDKPEVGSRIAWSGAGINLQTGSPSPHELRNAIHALLQNPSYREQARKVQADFARYDSPRRAADLLERLAQSKKPILAALAAPD